MIDNYEYEKDLISKGYKLICGIDEVGRGPIVGPVVCAAVILPVNYHLEGLTDSKKLTEKKREEFDKIIRRDAISYGIGIMDNKIIDEVNILEATKMAMYEAVSKLRIKPDYILIDAVKLDKLDVPWMNIIKGDLKSETIAAASVVAKVYRDHLMYELDKEYPEYEFGKHKGYPTKKHLENIQKYGILDNYRFTFKPVRDLINNGGKIEGKIRKTNI